MTELVLIVLIRSKDDEPQTLLVQGLHQGSVVTMHDMPFDPLRVEDMRDDVSALVARAWDALAAYIKATNG